MTVYRRPITALLTLAILLASAPLSPAAPRVAPQQQQQQQDPKTEQVWFERARNLYARGKYEEAITILTDFLKTYPDSMITDLALVWLARAYLQQGQFAEAESVGDRLRQMKDSPFIAIYESDLKSMRPPAAAATPAATPAREVASVTSRVPTPTPSPSPAPSPARTPERSERKAEQAKATPTPTPAKRHDPQPEERRAKEAARDEDRAEGQLMAEGARPVEVASTQPLATYTPAVTDGAGSSTDSSSRASAPERSAPAPAPQPGAFKLTIKQVPDLTLALRRAAEVAYPGQQVQIPLTVTNAGNKDDKFRLQTDIPAEYQPTLTVSQIGLNTGLPIAVTPTLARGASAELVLTLRVPDRAADGQSQSFQVRATSESDYNVVRVASGTVTVAAASLTAASSINGTAEALPGDTFKQTISVTNTGSSTARDTRAEFILNPEYELVSSDPQPAQYDRATRTAVWSLGDLDRRESKKIQLNVRISPEALASTPTVGRGTLRTQSIPLAANFGSPQFTIAKVMGTKLDALAPWLSATPGDRVYVPVAARNTGNAPDSYDLKIVAPGAPAATIYADTNGDGRHQETEPAITRTDTINPQGGQYRMLLAVDIPRGSASGQQFAYNVVSRSTTPGPVVASETSTIITVATPKLRVRTEQITESASPGDLIYYRLTLINEGNGLAKDIVVTEQLAGGLDFVSAEPKVKESKGKLTWKVEELAPNNTTVLLITARVNPNLQADSTLPARHEVQYKDPNGNPYQSQ